MCGIFAYLNFNCPKTRDDILRILVGGLKRLEYRGYDSAGIVFETGFEFIKRKFDNNLKGTFILNGTTV